MCEQGAEPDPGDDLIWIVTTENFWNKIDERPATNYYKKRMFSAFLEEQFSVQSALEHAKKRWGDKPYGIVRVRYRDLLECGYKAVFKKEDGIEAHVNVIPDPDSKIGKGKKAAMIRERSEVAVPFGAPNS